MSAQSKKPTLEKVLEAIKSNRNIVFIQDICMTFGFTRMSFYKWFPSDSNEYAEIMDALENNKTSVKCVIRDKLLECKNPAALIALYRLLGTPEERNALVNRITEEQKTDNDEEITLKMG